MAALQYRNQRQLIRLLNAAYNHAKAGSKESLPVAVCSYKEGKFTEIVDVRTPHEFQLEHIPGAVNLPVLSNEERVTVGTKYSKDKFEARKIGAALISKNISRHIEEYFLSKGKEYSPLIYCWRGGQRSGSLGIILSQIGFETYVLHGGYQKYRRDVREKLKTIPQQFQFRVISGMTGSGKTHILNTLREKGEQVLDLEALAKHKGSVLGLWHKETQPSQKQWDSNLLHELEQFTPDRPVWAESESRKIGSVSIPDKLFTNLCQAPRYCITLPLEERVKHILHCYPNWIEESDHLKDVLGLILVKYAGKHMVEVWHELIDSQKWEEFVAHILVNHYDPTYRHSQKKNNISGCEIEECCIPDLEKETVDDLVSSLMEKGNQSNNSETKDTQALSS